MATWARGVSFKNSDNTKNIGGIGIYGNDTTAEKLYIGLGTEPWNNAGVQLTSSAINFKGNKIYHAGDKPTLSDIGAAAASHNHSSLSGVNLISFNAQSSDGVSIKTIINESATYLDMFMYDDVNQDKFRWRFKPHSTDSALTVERSLMELYCKTASTTNTAHLDLYGSFKATDTITAPTFSGALTGNASTATKLQTARSINGTNFDGTGNITTANWGTARNITIGNTSKSVNGSGNVAWSLSEIGAAASTHTHSYLPLTGGTLTGETVFNHYLSLNAWSGYGSGKAQLWYNGSNKQLVIQPNAVTDIIVNNNKVYHAGNKPTAADVGAASVSSGVQNWLATIKCATWSRILYLSNKTTVGHTGLLNIQGTRNSVVFNVTLLITTSHPGRASIVQLNNTNYSNLQIRALVNSNGDTYVEVYDNANSATDSITQTLDITFTTLSRNSNLTKYTSFTDGTTLPSGFSVGQTLTTLAGTVFSGNSATTTKLQTARSINGTNFDGSGNITTANWGTARNIAIGRTTKSVNGSANVSWSTDEIGALDKFNDSTLASGKKILLGYASSWLTSDSGSGSVNLSAGGNLFLHGDRDCSNASEFVSLKAGNNDLRVISSGSGTGQDKLTFNGNLVYHAGRKPTAAEIGAAASSHNHDVLISAGGRITSADIAAKGDRGLRMYLATSSMTTGKPSSDGFILNFDWDTTAGWSSQMYIKNSNSPILQLRGMNAGTWGSWYTVYSTNNKPTPADIGAAPTSHSHSNYLPLSGGTVTGAISSSLTTSTHLAGNKGTAIINSTAAGNGYTMLAKMNSTNGVWTMGGWTDSFNLFYTANSVVSAESNNTTKRLILLNEAGNSSFPGTVSASSFSGSLSGNATTATTLQNTRTINGTNFNGSANITTANWGTARTITIGSTGKSVNGSGNVSWTVAEIGAAPASHSHSNYVPTSEYGLTTISKTLTIGTSWMDTGIAGTNLATGSYMVQVSGMAHDATSFYSEIWTGVMSWHNADTNSTDADEIVLHKAGHASNGRTIYLRTLRVASSGTLKLQICASTALKATNVTFKFRKLI